MKNTNTTNIGKLIYPDLSYKIIGCLINVHNHLGPCYQEKHYQRSLALEFKKQGLEFIQQKPLDLCYNKDKIGDYRFDFVVEDKVIIEIKVADSIHSNWVKQLLSYLKTSKYRLGILVNFGKSRLEYKRLVN